MYDISSLRVNVSVYMRFQFSWWNEKLNTHFTLSFFLYSVSSWKATNRSGITTLNDPNIALTQVFSHFFCWRTTKWNKTNSVSPVSLFWIWIRLVADGDELCNVPSDAAYEQIYSAYILPGGTRWCSWLRNCATSRKAAGSIPDGVIGFFHCHNPSGRTMALGLTQPLTEISTRNISWW